MLHIRPALGRLFVDSDFDPSAAPVALMSHELWQTRFGGKPDILNQTVRFDNETRTIVGILPAGLNFPLERSPSQATGSNIRPGLQHFWFPLRLRGADRTSRGARMFLAIGRLKTDEASARAELTALGRRLAVDHPETNRGMSFDLISLRDQLLGKTRRGIPLLAAAVGAVLMICCVNLANLLLARGMTRQRVWAVRLALGASRGRLIRTLMAENLVLALAGGMLGTILAQGALAGIRALSSTIIPFVREASIDWLVLAFTAGLSIITALIFSAVPAWSQMRIDATDALRSGQRTTAGPQIRRWQHGLLVGQVALVLVLLVSAGLLLESFRRLVVQDLGYKPRAVVAVDINTPSFETNGDVCRLYRALHDRLMGLPGVDAVGTSSSAPLTSKWLFNEKAQVVGQPLPEAERPTLAPIFVAFDYFQAMDIPLLEGRFFRDSELKDDGYGQIVMLNESAAQLLFPGRSAVGGRFTVGSNPDRVLEVIGVVKDTRDVRLEEKPQPRFYWQYAFGGAQIVIRSAVPARVLTPLVRDTVLQADHRILLESIRPMREILSATVADRLFLMTMLSSYSALALVIAALGIFGVVTYQVAQRSNEFGVRMALGATPNALLRLILLQAGRLVLLGLAIGLAVSLATNRLLASQLFGLSPHDPFMLIGASALLLTVALLASLWPARRAAKVDPVEALREF
jgi:putative ABC transport system permease protein